MTKQEKMLYTKNMRTNIGYLMSNTGGEYEQSRSWNPWGCTHTHTHTLCLLEDKISISTYALLNIYIRDG